jgi:hypothetical protein
MRYEYENWLESARITFDALDKNLATLETIAVHNRLGAAKIGASVAQSADAVDAILMPRLAATHDTNQTVARHLTYLGFDAEVAMSGSYAASKAGLDNISDKAKAALGLGAHANLKSELLLYPDAGCIRCGLDLLGLQLTIQDQGVTHVLVAQFAVEFRDQSLLLHLVRGPRLCPEPTMLAAVRTEIERLASEYILSDAFPSTIPVATSTGDAVIYMVSVDNAVRMFAKTGKGRHAVLAPMPAPEFGSSIALVLGTTYLAGQITTAITKWAAQASKPFHLTSVKLAAAPTMNVAAQAIDFGVSVSRKDEGGDIPATEWYAEFSANLTLRATFDAHSGTAIVDQIGGIRDLWVHFVWKGAKITIVDTDKMPDFFKKTFLKQFQDINFGRLGTFSLNMGPLEAVVVTADRVVVRKSINL